MALPTREDLKKLPGSELLTGLTQCVLLATIGAKKAGIAEFKNETDEEIARYLSDLGAELDDRLAPKVT